MKPTAKAEIVAIALAIRQNKTAGIAALAKRHGVSANSIRNWSSAVSGVDRADWPAALTVAKRPGAKKRKVIPPAIWSAFKADFLRLEQPTLIACHRAAQRRAGRAAADLPGVATFRRRLKEECTPNLVLYARHGETAVRSVMGIQTRDVSALAAGEVINGDGYTHNCFVLSEDGEKYRPVTWAWQDVRSRKIVGYRTDRSENKESLRMSLADVCRTYGVPRHIVIDNTRAAANKWLTGGNPARRRFKIVEEEVPGILAELGITAHFTSIIRAANGKGRGWGQAKPIERAFRDWNEFDKRFAGAYSGAHPTAKPDNYGISVIPEAVFKAEFKAFIAEFNARDGRRSHAVNGDSFDVVFAANYDESRLIKLTEAREMMLLLAAESRRVKPDGTLTLAAGGAADCPRNIYGASFLAAHIGKNLVVRFDPADLHAPVHVFTRRGEYLGAADCVMPVGFLDVTEARNLQRYRRREVAALKEAMTAVHGQQKTRRQLTEPRPARQRPAAAAKLPTAPAAPVPAAPAAADIIQFYKNQNKENDDHVN